MSYLLLPPVGGVQKVANATERNALAASAGDIVVQIDNDTLYIYDADTATWVIVGGASPAVTIGVFNVAGNAAGLSLTGASLSLHAATATEPGAVSTNGQTWAGVKTFASLPVFSSLSAAGLLHNDASGGLSSSLVVNADIDAAAAIVYTKLNLTGAILNADINGGAGIVYSKLNLTGSIVNADVSGAAAIVYSKLNLTGSIVNADVAAAAAIARSKVAAGTASHIVVNDASGNLSSTASLNVARGGTGLTAAPTNGQLPIGNGTGYTLATLTGTANRVTVTNSAGGITLSGPQDLATTSAPQFARVGLGTTSSGSFLINTSHFTLANGGGVVFNETGVDADFRVEAVGEQNGMFFDASTNRFGLGTATPDAEFTLERDAAVILYVKAYGDSSGIRPGYISARARGTRAAPTAVQAGDFLGEFTFRGHDGTALASSTRAGFRCRAAENWTPTANGAEFDFTTTPNGSTFPNVVMVISEAGWFGFGNMTTADTDAPMHLQNAVAGPLAIFDQLRISDENEVFRFYGNSRIGVGANDRAYHSYYLDQADSSRAEYARQFWVAEDITTGSVTGAHRFDVALSGAMTTMARFGSSVVLGSGSLNTTATKGFIYIPSCAGVPTGAPDSYTGRNPMIVDTTNSRLYVNVGGTWKYAALV